MRSLLALALASAAFAQTATAEDSTESGSPSADSGSPVAASWYFGLGLQAPDAFPIEVLKPTGRGDQWRFFLVPPFGTSVTEHQAAEERSYFNTVKVATPASNVKVDVLFGPVVGAEYRRFPWASPTFFAFGLSAYQMRAEATKSTPVLLCYDLNQACTPDSADLRTSSELTVNAKATTRGLRARASLGWHWDVGQAGYFSVTGIGLAKTVYAKRTVEVDSSFPEDPGLSDLANDQSQYVLEEREDGLKDKVLGKMEKYDPSLWPVIGLSGGIRF